MNVIGNHIPPRFIISESAFKKLTTAYFPHFFSCKLLNILKEYYLMSINCMHFSCVINLKIPDDTVYFIEQLAVHRITI